MQPQPNQLTMSGERAYVERKPVLDRTMKNGTGWFYWIAGMSLISSVVSFFGGSIYFFVGLGSTVFVDAVAMAVAEEAAPDMATAVRIGAFVISLLIAGLFILFGLLARRRYQWIMLTGMLLYAADGLIFLAFGEWLPVAFTLRVAGACGGSFGPSAARRARGGRQTFPAVAWQGGLFVLTAWTAPRRAGLFT
jgi:hypothetical protein